jgi:nonribosomal peptide synthetase DhbF
MKQFRCANGLLVWNAPKSKEDTRFIYSEVFEQHCYERHGLTVENGDVVLDVGANIGLFALSVMQRCESAHVVCVEPVPDVRACLERNVAESSWRKRHTVTVLDHAIGSRNGTASIAYFPRTPANSTMHLSDKRREWAAIVDEISVPQLWKLNKWFAVLLVFTFPWRRRVHARFVAPVLAECVTVGCEVRTLSDTIRRHGLEQIDLLKVDIEGAELEALGGIDEEHWPRIRQLVVEISPGHKGAVADLLERLHARGFDNVAVESMLGTAAVHDDPLPCTVYAVRGAPRTPSAGGEGDSTAP